MQTTANDDLKAALSIGIDTAAETLTRATRDTRQQLDQFDAVMLAAAAKVKAEALSLLAMRDTFVGFAQTLAGALAQAAQQHADIVAARVAPEAPAAEPPAKAA